MDQRKEWFRNIVLYGIFGLISAGFDFCMFLLLLNVFGIQELVANTISIHCGIGLSFTLNRNFNFKKTDKTAKRAITFYLVGLAGLVLSNVILYIGMQLGFQVEYVKLFSIIVVAAFQFLMNKLVTFK